MRKWMTSGVPGRGTPRGCRAGRATEGQSPVKLCAFSLSSGTIEMGRPGCVRGAWLPVTVAGRDRCHDLGGRVVARPGRPEPRQQRRHPAGVPMPAWRTQGRGRRRGGSGRSDPVRRGSRRGTRCPQAALCPAPAHGLAKAPRHRTSEAIERGRGSSTRSTNAATASMRTAAARAVGGDPLMHRQAACPARARPSRRGSGASGGGVGVAASARPRASRPCRVIECPARQHLLCVHPGQATA